MPEWPADPMRRSVMFMLVRLERLNDELLTAACSRRGVSNAEFRVLAVLRHGAPGEPVRPTTISRWIVQSTGGLTSTLGRLEDQGRIERIPDPGDGRGRLVSLTQEGANFYDGLLSEIEAEYAAVLEGIDTAAMASVLAPVVAAMEKRGGHAESGVERLSSGLLAHGVRK